MNKNSMRLADFVANFVATNLGVTSVFTVTGGGAMYLNDAFGSHPDISYIPMHHEQAASMAAEGYYRESNSIAVCQITTGPGGTNAVTGCAGAWVDSEPVLFISGQVESFSIANKESRQTGVQEIDILKMVKGITKGSIRITDPYMIQYELERLTLLATSGRFGPVWLDIPLDIQNFIIEDVKSLVKFIPLQEDKRVNNLKITRFNKALKIINSSQRPVIMIGNGCRHATHELYKFLNKFNVPVITGWNARDIIGGIEVINLGSSGLFGNRAANLAVQKADLVLGLGYRFSVPQTGYDPSTYATESIIMSVDIDHSELTKVGGFIDVPLNFDVKDFLSYFNESEENIFSSIRTGWAFWCKYLIEKNFDPPPENNKVINTFDFNAKLHLHLKTGDTIVTDMGTSFTCTHQDLKLKGGVKLFTSSGVAAMGFGLPGAIGSCLAKKRCTDKNKTILISGDGGMMFNLQDLQTVVTLKSNLKIIIYENGGYLTMKHMQEARFKRLVGSEKTTSLECVDFFKISIGFGIQAQQINSPMELDTALEWLFDDFNGPKILVVHIDHWQPLVPRVQTKSDSTGKLIPPSLDQMYPFLTDEEDEEISFNYEKLISEKYRKDNSQKRN